MSSFYENLIKNIRDISEIKNISTGAPIFGDYSSILTERGLCFGLTFMWTRAVLLGEKEKHLYFLRLQYLTRNYSENPLHLDARKWTNFGALLDYLYRLEILKISRTEKHPLSLIEKLSKTPPYVTQNLGTKEYTFDERQLPDLLRSIYPFLDGLVIYHQSKQTSLHHDQAMHGLERQNPLVGSEILKHYLHLLLWKAFVGTKETLNEFLETITKDIEHCSLGAHTVLTIANTKERHIIGVLIQPSSTTVYNSNFMFENFFELVSPIHDKNLMPLTNSVLKSFLNDSDLNLVIQIWTLKEFRHNFNFDHTIHWYLKYIQTQSQQDKEFSAKTFIILVRHCHNECELRLFFEQFPTYQNIINPRIIFDACTFGNTEYLKLLLEKNPDLMNSLLEIKETKTNMNVLHKSIKTGQVETLKFLFANFHNVNPNTTSSEGTPLQLACQYHHDAIIIFLLTHGAHILPGMDQLYVKDNKFPNPEIIQKLQSIR